MSKTAKFGPKTQGILGVKWCNGCKEKSTCMLFMTPFYWLVDPLKNPST
jgi:hypothetical protein